MTPIKCYLVEPVFDAPGTLPASDRDWDPEFRAILRWRRPDSGEERELLSQFAVGAMWRATWYPKNFEWDNETEPHLIVKTPGGDWDIDDRCSNCGKPQDNLHRCWVRHGEPPGVTVDKAGLTCAAGAGSIMQKTWHGFLRDGCLVQA
jgi:hypothetical protein